MASHSCCCRDLQSHIDGADSANTATSRRYFQLGRSGITCPRLRQSRTFSSNFDNRRIWSPRTGPCSILLGMDDAADCTSIHGDCQPLPKFCSGSSTVNSSEDPPFLSDLATGIIVSKLVRQLTRLEQKSRVAFLLWYANPFNIYWINVYGGMDVIPGMIFVFSLYYGMANKWYRCGVFAAIASLLRIFPILALPFFPSRYSLRGPGGACTYSWVFCLRLLLD